MALPQAVTVETLSVREMRRRIRDVSYGWHPCEEGKRAWIPATIIDVAEWEAGALKCAAEQRKLYCGDDEISKLFRHEKDAALAAPNLTASAFSRAMGARPAQRDPAASPEPATPSKTGMILTSIGRA